MSGFPIRRTAVVALTLALTVLPLSCGKSDKVPPPDSTASNAPGAARAVARGPGSARTYPGALTKPIDDYTGDELFELTRGLRFAGSHERQRKCRNAAGCEGNAPSQRTLVQVSAVATQDSLNAGDLPPYGVIAVRAINRGNAEEARYGLRPGGAVRYYLIVQRDSANGLRWRLEELQTTSPRRHAQVGSGRLTGCGHPWAPGARADFRTCAEAERGDSVVTMSLRLQDQLDSPLWIACDEGCCVAMP